jgi:thiosulfate/3-mercaptopyruvate sulfurtransferase
MTYARPEALVATSWLEANLEDPGIAVIEVDEDTGAFGKGHIPGAIALDWTTELRASPGRDFIDGHGLAALLASKGVSEDQRLVLYGGNNNWFAAYAYWLFRYRGLENVALLDGGRMKWELEGRDLSLTSPAAKKGRYSPGADRPELRAHRDEVIESARAGSGQMIDVRSPAEFTGETLAPPHLPGEHPYVPGHIPGAVNIPWSKTANEDGTFRSTDELTALYAASGITPDRGVVTYCRIGERSSHTWFVLSELLGFEDVRNYDGSWTEYGSLVGVPVAIGPAA